MRTPALLAAVPRFVLAAALLAGMSATAAEVYRWVDADGVIHYGDKPPTPDAQPVDLPPIQTIGPGPVSRSASQASEAQSLTPAGGQSIRVTSPAAEEVLRGDDRRLLVSVSLGQPLAEGAGVVYLLDGSPRNASPSSNLSFVMDDVERGSHLVSAKIVDGSGRELGRAAPVIVHMKPPTVNQAPQVPRPPRP